jgi:hypothetical protein
MLPNHKYLYAWVLHSYLLQFKFGQAVQLVCVPLINSKFGMNFAIYTNNRKHEPQMTSIKFMLLQLKEGLSGIIEIVPH